MNVLFLERNLLKNGVVIDQAERVGEFLKCDVLSVNVGKYCGFKHPKVININCNFFPKSERIKTYLFVKSVDKYIATLNLQVPNIIHSHFAYPQGYAAMKISKKYNIPFVVSGLGSDILLYPNESLYIKSCIKAVLKNCNAFVGVSKNILDKAYEMGLNESKSYFLPDGVNNEIFCLKKINKKISKNVILFVGNLVDVKNIKTLLNSFKLLLEKSKNLDLRLKIIGSGYLEKELKFLSQKLGVAKAVVFYGQLKQEEVANEMQNSDILCLPSLSEGWPNVIMEAMACGLPVVGADVGGIPEQIVSDEYGFLCNPESSVDIAEKLNEAMNKKWDSEKISKRGKMFDRNGTASELFNIYKDLLG